MRPEARRSRGTEDHLGAAAIMVACVMFATLPAATACSASALPSPRPESDTAIPTSSAQDTQEQIVKEICQQQKVDVSVNKCGDFYSTYPTGFIVDAATEIFDKSGKHIDSCGGNRAYSSDQAREEAERKCAAYLVKCTQVVKSCRSVP